MDERDRTSLPRHPAEADRGPGPSEPGAEAPSGPAPRPEPATRSGSQTPPELETPSEPELAHPYDTSQVGRRVVSGMIALTGGAMLFGRNLTDWWGKATGPATLPDGRPRSTGSFRIYTVTPDDPDVKPEQWRMKVTGLVDKPLDIGWDDLMALPQVAMTKDFQCVTGWRVTNVAWKGVLIRTLLDAAGTRPDGRFLTIRSFDGTYTESLTMEQARRDDMLVAHHLQGEVIRSAQGGPVRLYTAPMYGYKSLKWLSEIVVTDHLEAGYWEVRGYDIDAWVGQSNGRHDRGID